MIKLFISQPMALKSAQEIRAERHRAAIAAAKQMGETVFVLDSMADAPEGVNRGLWCLGHALQTIAEADVAYFAAGWDAARGCRLERRCAAAYGVPVIEEVEA